MLTASSMTRVALVALACAVLPAHADSFNARTGAWEMTTKIGGAGMTIPPDALARMPSEQRAVVEARIRQGHASVSKSCVTQESLDQGRFMERERKSCKVDVITQTSSKYVAKVACSDPKSQSTVAFEAKDREHVTGSIDSTSEMGAMHIDVAGRWLQASCEGVEDPMSRRPAGKN